MDKETVDRLEDECGAIRIEEDNRPFTYSARRDVFKYDQLDKFAQACCDWQKDQCGDLLSDALQSDLEHGVKWLNEKASKEFHETYPMLYCAINQIHAIRNAKESPESDIDQATRKT